MVVIGVMVGAGWYRYDPSIVSVGGAPSVGWCGRLLTVVCSWSSCCSGSRSRRCRFVDVDAVVFVVVIIVIVVVVLFVVIVVVLSLGCCYCCCHYCYRRRCCRCCCCYRRAVTNVSSTWVIS